MKTKIKKYVNVIFLAGLFFIGNLASAQYYSLPTGTGLPTSSNGIAGILSNLLLWLLQILGIIAVISFVVSGLQYLLAAGDEKAMQTAKRNATYSIIGVIVALSGYIAIRSIDMALRGTSLIF